MDKWDKRFMDIANNVATWSKDLSRGVGCVIVGPERTILATGYNGLPRGVNDEIAERFERPAKYKWTEHAERNAVYNAARLGVSLEGSTIYLPWFPCVDCARAIIQAGIKEMVSHVPDYEDPKWGEDFTIAYVMLRESNVNVRYVD